MIQELKLVVGWNPGVEKYQAVANYMIVSELQTFSRNDDGPDGKSTPGTYQGGKSALMQKHFEAKTMKELFENLKTLED